MTNVDNENGSVKFNQVAENTSAGADAPTMATIVFNAPDSSTDVTFDPEDSLVATSDAEAVTDFLYNDVDLDGDGGDAGRRRRDGLGSRHRRRLDRRGRLRRRGR